MKPEKKDIKWVLGGLALGIAIIAAANTLLRGASWGAQWVVNAAGWLIIAGVFLPTCELVWSTKPNMKYVKAIAACFVILAIYVTIAVALEWRQGGGYLVKIIFFGACVAAWKHFTNSSSGTTGAEPLNAANTRDFAPPPPKPVPFAGFQDIPKTSKAPDTQPHQLLGGK